MSNIPSFVSEPQVTDLPKLLDDVRRGFIQVPKFQRPFIWDDERRIELLRSIRTNIPIGSLLVWRTASRQLPCFEHIAGIRIPKPTQGQTLSYLLDGHQRVTTLFSAFSEDSHRDSEDTLPSKIFFDLEQDDFVVAPINPDTLSLPVAYFLDAVKLRKWFREKERQKTLSIEKLDVLQARAEEVLYTFQWCRIPVVPLTTDDLTLATRSFHRVNSHGAPMTEIHMVAALTWNESFDLRETINNAWEQISEPLPQYWSRAEDQQVLNVLKGILKLEVAKASEEQLIKKISATPEKVPHAVKLLSRAMHLIAEKLLPIPTAIPYQMQLTLTAIALDELDTDIDFEQFRRWWGLTTVWGTFSGGASHRIQAALGHLKEGLRGNRKPWPTQLYRSEDFLEIPSLDFRNARAKYYVAGYAERTKQIPLLHERGSQALITLFRNQTTRAGNRFVWPSEKSKALYEALKNGNLEELEGHFIDETCLHAYQTQNEIAFLTHREDLLNAQERNWFSNLHPKEFIQG